MVYLKGYFHWNQDSYCTVVGNSPGCSYIPANQFSCDVNDNAQLCLLLQYYILVKG